MDNNTFDEDDLDSVEEVLDDILGPSDISGGFDFDFDFDLYKIQEKLRSSGKDRSITNIDGMIETILKRDVKEGMESDMKDGLEIEIEVEKKTFLPNKARYSLHGKIKQTLP